MKPHLLWCWHGAPRWKSRGRPSMFGLHVLFEPRDLWLGAYWNCRSEMPGLNALDVYLCVVPMLPVRLMFYYDASKGTS